MSARLRLALAVVAVSLPAAALGSWKLSTLRAAQDDYHLAPPTQIGPWNLTQKSFLDEEVLANIEPLDYAMHLYEAPGRAPIWLYISIYAGRGGYIGAHDPSICYPSQGWEVLKTQPIDLPMNEAGGLRARYLDAHKARRREAVLYWFQPAGRWPSDGVQEQGLQMLDAVLGRPQYAFVRLSTDESGEFDSAQDLLEFGKEIAPYVRKQVEELL